MASSSTRPASRRSRAAHAFVLIAAYLAMTLPGRGQTARLIYSRFDPLVIPSDRTAPVLFEASVGATGQQVRLNLVGGQAIALQDDGSSGDRTAGDAVYSGMVPVSAILPLLQASDVNRVSVGSLVVTGLGASGNIFAEVITPDIPRLPITSVASDVQVNDYIANVLDPGFFVGFDRRRVTQAFYRYFGDDYDFINIVYDVAHFANRSHGTIKNTVGGIGLAQSDASASYGSDGRLLGSTGFPSTDGFDGANTGYVHELGHQWINFLSIAPFNAGIPHWPLSTMATGVMGWSTPGGEGLSFPCRIVQSGGAIQLQPRTDAPVFGDFDLYLMGLLPASAVGANLVLLNLTTNPPCTGQTYTGPTAPALIDDVIARFGPRAPAVPNAPSRFRVATVVVSRDTLLDANAMSFYAYFARRAEATTELPVHEGLSKYSGKPFAVATGGRGTLDARLTAPTAAVDFDVRAAPADLTVTRGSSATTTVRVGSTAGSFAERVTLSCSGLPSRASCSFSPADLVPGSAGATSTLTIATSATAADARASAAVLLAAVIFLVGAVPRRAHHSAFCGIGVACVAAIALGALACGPNSPKPPPTTTTTSAPAGTPPGTYTVTVTAAAGSIRHTATITLRVQ